MPLMSDKWWSHTTHMQESSASSPHDMCVMEVVSTTNSIQKRMTVPDYWSAETAWETTQAQRLSYAKELQCRKQHSIIPPSTSRWSLISKMVKSKTMHATACCSRHKTWYQYTCHNMQKVANLTRSVHNNGRTEGNIVTVLIIVEQTKTESKNCRNRRWMPQLRHACSECIHHEEIRNCHHYTHKQQFSHHQ